MTRLPAVNWKGKEVDAILVIINRFTKYTLFLAVSTTITTTELVELFHYKVKLIYGQPQEIISDRGPIFTSEFWAELCYVLYIKRRLLIAFYPQTDGQIERIN